MLDLSHISIGSNEVNELEFTLASGTTWKFSNKFGRIYGITENPRSALAPVNCIEIYVAAHNRLNFDGTIDENEVLFVGASVYIQQIGKYHHIADSHPEQFHETQFDYITDMFNNRWSIQYYQPGDCINIYCNRDLFITDHLLVIKEDSIYKSYEFVRGQSATSIKL